MKDELAWGETVILVRPSSLILHPSSFILHPSSFILHPSSFILHPSSFILLFAPFIQQRRHQGGPSRLMRRSQSRSVVAVEILVKQHVIAPVGILLKLLRPSINRAAAGVVAQK